MRLLGDPAPGLVTTPVVESLTIRLATALGSVRRSYAIRYATKPQTWGEAIEVPEMVLLAESDPIQAEVMSEPGAKASRVEPKLE